MVSEAKHPNPSLGESSDEASWLWMWPVRFVPMTHLLHAIRDAGGSVTAAEMDQLLSGIGTPLTGTGRPPGRTVLFHYRNVMLHLGCIRREGRQYRVNAEDHDVAALLAAPPSDGLHPVARDGWANLVLRNEDCQTHFFVAFAKQTPLYNITQFRREAERVYWSVEGSVQSGIFHVQGPTHSVEVAGEYRIRPLIYALRYWARDELQMTDELATPGSRVAVYAIAAPEDQPSMQDLTRSLSAMVDASQEWTTVSIRAAVESCGVALGASARRTLEAVDALVRANTDRIMLQATSRAMATYAAVSNKREDLVLRTYYRDGAGRLISHLLMHRSVREPQ